MLNQSVKINDFMEEQIEKKYSSEMFEKVISAVHCSFNPTSSNEDKQNALKYLEDLKENHPLIGLSIAFELLKQTNQQAILYHYSLNLIESVLKSKWNLLKTEERNLIKKQLFLVIKASYSNPIFLDITHIRNSLAKCFIELIKRDCFDKTNTTIDELIIMIQEITQIQDTNSTQLELILAVFRYLNEDLTIYSHSMQAQRRRQILNQLQKRLNDILPCLIRLSNDLFSLPNHQERLTETSLLTVNSFLTWVEYNHVEQYEYFLCELFLKFFQLNSIKIRHASFECLLSLVNKRLARKQLQQQQQQRNKRIASTAALNCQQEKIFLNYLLGDQTFEMFYRLLINPTDSLEQLRSIVTNDHINCLKMFGQFLLKLSNYILQLFQQLTTKSIDDNEFLLYINERTNAFLQYLLLLNQHPFHLLSLNAYQSLNLFLIRQSILLSNEEFCLKLIFNIKQSLYRIHFPTSIMSIDNQHDELLKKQFVHNQQCFIYALFEYDSEEQFFWKFFSQYRSELQKLIKSFIGLFFNAANSDRIEINLSCLKSMLEKLFLYLESLVQRTPNRSSDSELLSLSSTYLIIEWEACYLLLDHVLFVIHKELFPSSNLTVKSHEKFRSLLLTPVMLEQFLRVTKYLLQFTPNLSEHIHGHVLNLLSCLFFITPYEQKLAIDILQRLLTTFQIYQQHSIVGIHLTQCEVLQTQSSHAFLYLCKNFTDKILEYYSELFPFVCQLYKTEFERTKNSLSITIDEQTSPTLKLLDAAQILFYQKALHSTSIDSKQYEDYYELVKPIYEILTNSLKVESLNDFIDYMDFCSKRTQPIDVIRYRRRNLKLALHCLCLLLRLSKQEQPFETDLHTKICFCLRTLLFEHVIKVTQFCNQLYDRQTNPFYDLLKTNLTYSDTERQLYLGTYESNNMAKATISSTIAPSSLPVSYIRFQNASNTVLDDHRLRDYLHRLFDICYQINGMYFAHDHQLYNLKLNNETYFLTTYIQKILFENFNTLPSFRLRIVLRHFCRSFVENYSPIDYPDKDTVNELFLSFLNLFLPYIQERLNLMWNNLLTTTNLDAHLREDECSDEVIEECICVLITRDFNDIIRYLIYKTIPGQTNSNRKKTKMAAERSLSENMSEDVNGDFEQIDDCDEQSITNNRLTNSQEYSDLFSCMTKMSRQDSPLSLQLFSSLIKILFECLTFPDAYCLNRFLPIILPVTKLYTDILDKHANPSILIDLRYLFQCLLKAFARHSENEGVNTNLMSLIGHIYELWFQRYSSQLDFVFQEYIPQFNFDLLNTYKTRLTNQTNTRKQQITERERRDTVRGLLNPILLSPLSKKDGANPMNG